MTTEIDQEVLKIRELLSLTINQDTIHELRNCIQVLHGQVKSLEPLLPHFVNDIVLLMQDVYEAEEQFVHSGITNVGGAPQLRHDLLLIVAILSDILDADSLEKVELAPDLALFEWLIEFKDSDQFDRTAKHPLSLSHIVVRALLLFGLDSNNQYDVKRTFQTIAAAVFRGQIHHSYFEYATRYVHLKFACQ